MKLTQQEIDRAIEMQFQKDLKKLLEVASLYNKSNRMLIENRLSKEEYETLNEGLWEKAKYYMSKLGRYKAGGKIFGKGKIDQEAATKIQAIIDKKGNEMIKALNNSIKEKNPEFPNNEKGQDFLNTVLEISAVYDSVVAATKKDPKEEGFLPIDAANTIIEDLAEYVKKFLDVDLTAAYSVMDSEKEKVNKDTELLTDEVEDINEDEAEDVRTRLQVKKSDDAADRESERKKTSESNRLPALLLGVGASLGAFSWLTNTEWFKHLFEETFKYTDTEKIKDVIETKTQVLNDIKPGEGVYKLLGRVTGHPLNGNSDPSEMVNALKQIGGGDAHKGVDLLCQEDGVMMKPTEAAKGLHSLVNNPDQYTKLGDMFKDVASGTGKLAEPGTGLNTTLYGTIAGKSLTSLLVERLPVIITKTVIKTGVKIGAGYTVAKGFGAVLGPIGIGLVTAGVLVKLMRMKGQKQSRAKTLYDLLNSIQPVKGTSENQPILPQDPQKGGGAAGGGTGGGGTDNEQLFNDLSKFFQFVVNNEKQLNIKGGVSGEALISKKDRDNPCYNFKVGDILIDPDFTIAVGGVTTIIKLDAGDITIEYINKKSGNNDTSELPCKDVVDAIKNGEIQHKKGKKNENIMKNEMILTEGKFIKDKRTLEYLNKKSRPDKVKRFEEFLTRLEIIRNKVKKMGNTEDKVINNFVKKLKSNPIIATDFVKMFNVPSDNPKGVQSLKGFIDEIFDVIYSGKNKKMVNMVDKMATLGGGNINKMEESYLYEEKGYNADEPNKAFLKDAQDRGSFKKHLNNFIFELMNMFQYMYKLKKEGKLSGGTKKPAGTKPEPKQEPKQESVKKLNPLLTEEINKIKSLMFKIS